MTRIFAGLAAMLFVFLLTGPANAGAIAPCSEPFVFEGSDVNIVILPYSFRAPDEKFRQATDINAMSESDAARKLSGLLQVSTLYSLSYPASMAVVHLFPDTDYCDADEVMQIIVPRLGKGKGLIVVWGYFILGDAGEIYAQQYLRFLRRGQSGAVNVIIPAFGSNVRLRGQPPQHAIGFAPRLLSSKDLQEMEEQAWAARQIWSKSSGGSVVAELPEEPDRRYAYYVTGIDFESGRMEIQPHADTGLPGGWLAVRGDWPLDAKLPEFTYLNALAGYLAARIIADEKPAENWAGPWERRLARARQRSQAGFARFRAVALEIGGEGGLPFDDRAAAALSHTLEGVLDLVAYQTLPAELRDPDRRKDAEFLKDPAASFAEAATLIPYQSDTRNLLAISRAGAANADRDQAAQAVKAWGDALSLDPANKVAAANLTGFYRLLLTSGNAEASGFDSAEVQARLDSLRR